MQADIVFVESAINMAMGPMYCQKLTCIFLLEVRPALLVYLAQEKQPWPVLVPFTHQIKEIFVWEESTSISWITGTAPIYQLSS